MEWDYFLNKRVFIQLKKGDCYTGEVVSVGDGFIAVIDKFKERVALALSEVSKIKEENNNNPYKQANLGEAVE